MVSHIQLPAGQGKKNAWEEKEDGRDSKQGVLNYSQTESLPGKKSLSSSCYLGVRAPDSI